MEPPCPPHLRFADPDDVLRVHEKFDSVLAKHLLTQSSKLRGLEDALRVESTAMLKLLQDQVCAQLASAKCNPVSSAPSGLTSTIDELFARPEVRQGLVEWLGDDKARTLAEILVKELREDVSQGDGNEARTTVNKLLLLYMEALSVGEMLQMYGDKMPAASPGGKSSDTQRKLLGQLIMGGMRPYLEAIQMMYLDSVGEIDVRSYTAEKPASLRESARRLTSALFVVLNTGNFASHNRGKLSYCQQLELCAAVGAMAETLPQVYEACQAIKAAEAAKEEGIRDSQTPAPRTLVVDTAADILTFRMIDAEEKMPPLVETLAPTLAHDDVVLTLETTNPTERAIGSEVTLVKPIELVPSVSIQAGNGFAPSSDLLPAATVSGKEIPGQFNHVAYYKRFLTECSPAVQAKYEATLVHMELVSKARVCAQGTACISGEACNESHSNLEALPFNPLVMTLKCPVPERCWDDFVHEREICLFNHGEYKGAGTLRWGKRYFCAAQANCKDCSCLKSHSMAEVCWFNPHFRTTDCPEGHGCPWKYNCIGFHKGYHSSKRNMRRNEYLGTPEPILFIERTISVLRKVSPSSRPTGLTAKATTRAAIPGFVLFYQKHLQKATHFSFSDQEKYSRVLKHMQMVSKARMCMNEANGNTCIGLDASALCAESHTLAEALAFNPLAMVLACPTPANCREDFIHQNGLCVFYHSEEGVPKEFLKAKRLLCDDLGECKDASCMKSHSETEVCWHFSEFRISKCPQRAECKRMGSCSYYHGDFHTKRDQAMNNVVGEIEPALFIERGCAELLRIATPPANDLHEIDGLGEESQHPALPPSDDDSTSVYGGAASDLPKQEGNLTIPDYEQTLNECPVEERSKYEDVLTHMKMVSKTRLCTHGELCPNRDGISGSGDTATCLESHSRAEALAFNPLAMLLRCPMLFGCHQNDIHRQSLCVFDHGEGNVPKGFLKDKRTLCEYCGGCEDDHCAKSHSIAEVCWFNPHFRVNDCPHGDTCPRKENCSSFHASEHTKRDDMMNSQVGVPEKALFVDRTYAVLTRRRAQALRDTQPRQDEELTSQNAEALQNREDTGAIPLVPKSPKLITQSGDEPNREGCKLS